MNPRIEKINEKKLIGTKLIMSFTNYKISELWRDFLPRQKEISNRISNDMISLAIYSPSHFKYFDSNNEFEKWAAVEVSEYENIPTNMQPLILTSGLYAVFEYQGLNSDNSIYNYIYNKWLPSSNYILDNRPHFEVLGEKYRNNDISSEEEIWIPVRSSN